MFLSGFIVSHRDKKINPISVKMKNFPFRAYPGIAGVPIAPDEGDLTQAYFVYGEENRRSMAQNLQASAVPVISG